MLRVNAILEDGPAISQKSDFLNEVNDKKAKNQYHSIQSHPPW